VQYIHEWRFVRILLPARRRRRSSDESQFELFSYYTPNNKTV